MKRGITSLICVLLIAGILISPAFAQLTNPPVDEPTPQVPHNKNNKFQEATALTAEFNEPPQTSGRFIVQLMTPSLVAYDGGVSGIQKAPIDAQGKINFNMSATRAYLKHVNNEIDRTVNNASRAVGRDISKGVVFRYDTLFGGFAVEMTEKEARAIAQLEEVKAVYPDYIMWPQTDLSPAWLGTTGVWDGRNVPETGETQLTKGEGVLVGILDTGINMDHPSFAETGPVDGFIHTNPFGADFYKGLCETNPTDYKCNDKLVGVYSYITRVGALLGEDDHGHGSHTASTVAGNMLAVPYGSGMVTISGMAPHANIIAYDVCDYISEFSGGCPYAAILAATQQALLDGVDVINFSIGPNAGPGQNPYSDPIELAFLEIVGAGGVVSTSAGNSGPDAQTTWKGAPWEITVANTGHRQTAADVLNWSSSRGPFILLDVLEPEIAAPGTNVLAAYSSYKPASPYGIANIGEPVEIALKSGTSMASPHVAGNAALLRALFPTWSGMEIKSALMMTALAGTTRDNDPTSSAIDAFDYGNGRLDMTKAALTGLVMNETYANMVAANPATGGDVKTLNIPSYQNSQCVGVCSFTRTFRSVADVSATYTAKVDASTSPLLEVTIEPSSFTIAPGGTRSVTITIDVSRAPIEAFDFGRVTFATNAVFSSGEAISSVAIPFAVKPTGSSIPTYLPLIYK